VLAERADAVIVANGLFAANGWRLLSEPSLPMRVEHSFVVFAMSNEQPGEETDGKVVIETMSVI